MAKDEVTEIDEAELAAQYLERAASAIRRRRTSWRKDFPLLRLEDKDARALMCKARDLYHEVRQPELDASRPAPQEQQLAEAAVRQLRVRSAL